MAGVAGSRAWLANQVSLLLGFESDETVDYLLTFRNAADLREYAASMFGDAPAVGELVAGLSAALPKEAPAPAPAPAVEAAAQLERRGGRQVTVVKGKGGGKGGGRRVGGGGVSGHKAPPSGPAHAPPTGMATSGVKRHGKGGDDDMAAFASLMGGGKAPRSPPPLP